MTNGVIEGGAISIINKSNDFNKGFTTSFTHKVYHQQKAKSTKRELNPACCSVDKSQKE